MQRETVTDGSDETEPGRVARPGGPGLTTGFGPDRRGGTSIVPGRNGSTEDYPRRILAWTALALVVLVATATLLATVVYRTDVDGRIDETRILAVAAAGDIDRYLQSQLGALTGIAAADEVTAGDPDRMKQYFERVDPPTIGFDGAVFWVDVSGWMRARSGYAGPPLDFSDREWVRHVLSEDEPYVSNARIGQLNRAPIVVLAVPTHSATGAISGVLGGAFRLDQLRTGAYDLRSAAGGTRIGIIDRIGHLVAGDDPIGELETVVSAFDYEGLRASGSGILRDVDGPTGLPGRVVGYAGAPTGDWLIVIERSESALVAPARDRLVQQLALIGLLALLAFAVVVATTRRLRTAMSAAAIAYEREFEAHRSLAALVDELKVRAEAGEAFVSVLSHELRTPVTTIYGMANLLRRSPERGDRETIAEDIEDEAERLRRIVEDLLVLSRAEAGTISLATEPILVQRLATSIAADVTRRFHGLPLVVDLPRDLPPVAGEEGPLRQVLTNLLTNAAKYGEGGQVRLAGRSVGQAVVIEVEDEGPGFPAEDRERLFELFYRSPRTARRAAGTGIGLYVVRRLVGAMGGEVSAAARPAGGSVFTVRLPVYGVRHDEGTAGALPVDATAPPGGPSRELPASPHEPTTDGNGVVAPAGTR